MQLDNADYEATALMAAANYAVGEIAVELRLTRRQVTEILLAPEVKDRVQELTQITLGKLKLEAQDIIQAVTDIAFNASNDPRVRLEALRLLGKQAGMFIDKKIIEGGDKPVLCTSMTDAIRGKLDEIYK